MPPQILNYESQSLMPKAPLNDSYDENDELLEFTVTVVTNVSVSARSRSEAEAKAIRDVQDNPEVQEWYVVESEDSE